MCTYYLISKKEKNFVRLTMYIQSEVLYTVNLVSGHQNYTFYFYSHVKHLLGAWLSHLPGAARARRRRYAQL